MNNIEIKDELNVILTLIDTASKSFDVKSYVWTHYDLQLAKEKIDNLQKELLEIV